MFSPPFLRSLLTPKNRGKKIKKRGGTRRSSGGGWVQHRNLIKKRIRWVSPVYLSMKSSLQFFSLSFLINCLVWRDYASIQHGYPHHTICYATNRLMAYINKKILFSFRCGNATVLWFHLTGTRSYCFRVRKWFVMFFDLQKDNSPAIIFIDEVDSIATARFDAETGAARELQFRTAEMNLSDEVDLEDYVSRPDKVSAAEIAAICQETGMLAIRKNRYVILHKDFEKGYRSNMKEPDIDFEFYK
ncbi:26S proteasome regulatory subunitB [Sesamum angolense]|uniref:26S proteasome regulatory subunitB n=3 Tax=Sesamum TaxID=4181 RepID=A0AAE1T5B9_9LAMI|nr:26S proteasome regulatory subunitB [Sesamum angolense]